LSAVDAGAQKLHTPTALSPTEQPDGLVAPRMGVGAMQ